MADLSKVVVQVRAQQAAWRGQGRALRSRAARSRHVLVSVLLVVAGLAGAPFAGLLVGRWMAGLVLLAECGGAVWFGLMRDDGTGTPQHGERTPLEAAREHMRGVS